MANIFSPQKSSDENLTAFLNLISDEDIKSFLSDNLEDILMLGADSSNNELKESIFSLVDNMVIDKMAEGSEEDEDQEL